jgi:hypothetical protein
MSKDMDQLSRRLHHLSDAGNSRRLSLPFVRALREGHADERTLPELE